MVDHADEVIAVWNGKESGTKNCVDYARSCGKDVIWINLHELIQINMVKANEVMQMKKAIIYTDVACGCCGGIINTNYHNSK